MKYSSLNGGPVAHMKDEHENLKSFKIFIFRRKQFYAPSFFS